jgi:hypothetical protein
LSEDWRRRGNTNTWKIYHTCVLKNGKGRVVEVDHKPVCHARNVTLFSKIKLNKALIPHPVYLIANSHVVISVVSSAPTAHP